MSDRQADRERRAMTDEFVTRATYAAMVAERDALAARAETAEAMVAAQADNRRMDRGRIEMLKAERDSLETRLAAAHGLQSERDALTAECGTLRRELQIADEARRELIVDRDVLDRDIAGLIDERNRLTAKVIAAHGLQSRAERAEAERDRFQLLLADSQGDKLRLRAERAEAALAVASEIVSIMECYDEQEAEGHVDTAGRLEHMGDVWRLLDRWRAAIAAVPS